MSKKKKENKEMAIDVKTISCQQCGSTDVNMTSETQGVCKVCGAKFTVQQRIDTQNVYNEVHVHNESEQKECVGTCFKAVINPEFSQNDFIRNAWISLAKEDAPIEVFSENFDDVSIIDHQVVADYVAVNIAYQVNIGYDRQEPYIAYEMYYEKEPYIAYEKRYNTTTRQYEKCQVTKYKDVKSSVKSLNIELLQIGALLMECAAPNQRLLPKMYKDYILTKNSSLVASVV